MNSEAWKLIKVQPWPTQDGLLHGLLKCNHGLLSYGNLLLLLICKYYTIVSVCMCYIKLYKTGETVLYNFIRP